MSSKMTNQALRDMTRDFVRGAVKAKMINESMEELPPPQGTPRTQMGPGGYHPGTDADILLGAIQFAITEALDEDLGLTAEKLDALKGEVMLRKEKFIEAINKGFADYERKLGLMGGKAKPRSI